MGKFMLMTERGTTPPRYVHQNIESAVEEAQRLLSLHKSKVTILEVVGFVEEVEVPVTKKEVKVTLKAFKDDLPF